MIERNLEDIYTLFFIFSSHFFLHLLFRCDFLFFSHCVTLLSGCSVCVYVCVFVCFRVCLSVSLFVRQSLPHFTIIRFIFSLCFFFCSGWKVVFFLLLPFLFFRVFFFIIISVVRKVWSWLVLCSASCFNLFVCGFFCVCMCVRVCVCVFVCVCFVWCVFVWRRLRLQTNAENVYFICI